MLLGNLWLWPFRYFL